MATPRMKNTTLAGTPILNACQAARGRADIHQKKQTHAGKGVNPKDKANNNRRWVPVRPGSDVKERPSAFRAFLNCFVEGRMVSPDLILSETDSNWSSLKCSAESNQATNSPSSTGRCPQRAQTMAYSRLASPHRWQIALTLSSPSFLGITLHTPDLQRYSSHHDFPTHIRAP